jgi:hypothetical protein
MQGSQQRCEHRDMNTQQARRILGEVMQAQADACAALGSPLYAHLLGHAAEDVRSGGPTWRVTQGHEDDQRDSMLALRLMGAAHRLVLEGGAPRLARHYPSAGGRASHRHAWAAFAEVLEQHCDQLRSHLEHPVQTNEAGRSAALVGGFLTVARETDLPVRVLEVGASAGLNLRWDRYRYVSGGRAWGDRRSPLRFAGIYEGSPPLDQPCEVIARRGCDHHPIDATSRAGELTLTSYIWPDQTERLERLRRAVRVARRLPVIVDRASAGTWAESQLDRLRRGTATVLMHSIVWQYLSGRDRHRMRVAIEEAGRRTRRDTAFAWLRMEPDGDMAVVTLTLWPGGTERRLARAGYHGRPVVWL